jgi:hypothetical protein
MTVQKFPKLAPFLIQNLEDILHGEDMSLIWRRDGLSSLPLQNQERLQAYREMASLKTGSLFRLLGQLVLEDHSADETMTTVALVWSILPGTEVGLLWLTVDADGTLNYKTIVRMSTLQTTLGRRVLLPKIYVTKSFHIPSYLLLIPLKDIGLLKL